jgi:NACalpha-BTF3-like transcription factor
MCRKAATDLEVPTKQVSPEMTNLLLSYIGNFNTNYNYRNIIPPNNAAQVEPLPRVQVRQLDDDAQVVATQAGVSLNVATEALQRANGDIVDAIMALTA